MPAAGVTARMTASAGVSVADMASAAEIFGRVPAAEHVEATGMGLFLGILCEVFRRLFSEIAALKA